MSAPKLRDPIDQGAWLACLAASASVIAAQAQNVREPARIPVRDLVLEGGGPPVRGVPEAVRTLMGADCSLAALRAIFDDQDEKAAFFFALQELLLLRQKWQRALRARREELRRQQRWERAR